MKKRAASIRRKTRETAIALRFCLDGEGQAQIDTGIPFFNHMLELFARHGLFDLVLRARGDLAVDYHHTVEDVGICLGEALAKALGDKKSIRRYGSAVVPMDESLAEAAVDLSGRAFLVYRAPIRRIKIGDFNLGLLKSFFQSFADHGRLTLHIELRCGEDAHHAAEAVFKACGRALRQAVERDPRVKGIPSTKGKL